MNSGADLNAVSAKSFRLGGNRMSAYNWENNVSNAGSDWKNLSDMYLIQNVADEFKLVPAGAILNAANEAKNGGVPYTLITLQMLGYTSSEKIGYVHEEDAAPSDYWFKVVNRKEGEFGEKPNRDDDVVYMDELLDYLIKKLGTADTETGIKAYALDNEPGLWQHTHSLVQREKLTCDELIAKSVDLAWVVKRADGGAEVYSLYGDSPLVRQLEGVGEISGNSFTYTLPALSVTEFVVNVSQPEPNVLSYATGGIAAVGAAVAVTVAVRNRKKK